MLQRLRSLLGLATAAATPMFAEPVHNSPKFEKAWTASRFDQSIVSDPESPGQVWYSGNYASRGEFESAGTDRLNVAHWSGARDTPINDDLAYRLPEMRTRSNHEAWNNTTIEGLILQHGIAVAGDNGPLLDLQAEAEIGDAWCEQAERVWGDWCEYSDAGGQLTLAARMKNFWNRGCWVNGEWFDQLIYRDDVTTPLRLRLHAIEAQRIHTPSKDYADPNIALGVKRDKYRTPTAYFIGKDWYGYSGGDWYNARDFIHGFELLEVGQARGVPWCQSGLPISADLRDYEVQVMDAARAAADMAIVLQTKHVDAGYVKTNAAVPFRRRVMQHIAPGWEAAQMQANQPAAQYKDFKHEKMGDIGRGKGVPQLAVRVDAKDHTLSGARVDRSFLHESAKHVRTTIYDPKLKPLVMIVISEAVLAGIIPPPPCEFRIEQIWPAKPEVDDDKAAKAEKTYMANGTMSYSAACAEGHGRRANDVIRIRQRDAKRLLAAGLPSVEQAVTGGSFDAVTVTTD